LKTPVKRRKHESGQAVILVILAINIFLMAALALLIDGSYLYAQQQLAQAAADAAAQAGIMDMLQCANGTCVPCITSACTANAQNAASSYAQMNGFGQSSDTVTPTISTTAPIQVTVGVQRPVSTPIRLWPSPIPISAGATARIMSGGSVALVQ
jgi:Flp pilus assembly protein TadG